MKALDRAAKAGEKKGEKDGDKDGAKGPTGIVNTNCPIMSGSKLNPEKITPDLIREFKGQKVGFCCAGCPRKWDGLSDADKEKALAKAK